MNVLPSGGAMASKNSGPYQPAWVMSANGVPMPPIPNNPSKTSGSAPESGSLSMLSLEQRTASQVFIARSIAGSVTAFDSWFTVCVAPSL